MNLLRHLFWMALVIPLLNSGCATSPADESRRDAAEADILAILSHPPDQAEFGETKRCLYETDYRNFRVLDDRRILFEGRKGKLWLNTLRTRCADLRHMDVLVVRPMSASRICDSDTFTPGDWFDWPWYRRWPWTWGGGWGTGMTCHFGKFQPVTTEQVEEIKTILGSI